jgi:hypothetical protein
LFSDIGPIKRARFLDKGIAEVIYVKMSHAVEAIEKYDGKELDGNPMRIIYENNAPTSRIDQFRSANSSTKTNFSMSFQKYFFFTTL